MMMARTGYISVVLIILLFNFWLSWVHHTRVTSEWENLKVLLQDKTCEKSK